jgi:proteasome lid subunit RPN8/RPN11
MFVPPSHAKRVVALFHTHPEGTPWPSDHDMEQSHRLKFPGVIVTPDRTCCVYKGYKVIATFAY